MSFRSDQHAQAVARRLELLSAELARERPPADDGHTRVRRAEGAEGAGAEGRLEAGSDDTSPRPGRGPDPTTEDVGAEWEPQVGAVPVPLPGRHAARARVAGAGRLPRAWVERAVLGPGPVAVVAVLAAVGLAFACWWLLRAQPEPVQLEATSVGGLTTPVPAGGPTSAGGAAAAAQEVVVHVAGKVRRPGIVVLEPGARIVDAVEAAGGPRRGVELTGLNLARVLVDGEQVVVGVAPASGPAAAATGPAAATGGLLNLNTATSEQLQDLPGVGPVTAEAILAFRTDHGPFTSVEELLDVSGIGDATLAEIAPHVTV